VAVWGLTFKANTDDRRESPSLAIVQLLQDQGAVVRAYDPTVSEPPGDFEICDDPYGACDGASVLAVLTEWDEFRWLDFQKVHSLMAKPAIVDARNLLDRNALMRLGFSYAGIGRS